MKKIVNRSKTPIRLRYKGEGCIIYPKQILDNINPEDFSPYKEGEKMPNDIYFIS